MARNDDNDDDDRRRKRSSRDDEEDADDDRPRRKSVRDRAEEVDAEDDRPRRKSGRDGDEDGSSAKTASPLPVRLIGAIIASLAWGILTLYGGCFNSAKALAVVIDINEMRQRPGLAYMAVGAHVILTLAGGLLIMGGVGLLMGRKVGKYFAIAGPVSMFLVGLITLVIVLVVTKGMSVNNVGFIVDTVLSLAVAGLITFLLLNKDVDKTLT